MIKMELAEFSLAAAINQKRKEQEFFDDKFILNLFVSSLKTLEQVKKDKNMHHRDIKPANFLMFKN